MQKFDDTQNNHEQAQTETTNTNDTPQEKTAIPQQETDYKDLFIRCTADLQNYKKRTEKERSEWMLIAQAEVLGKILPIVDDIERAFEHMPESTQSPRSV